MKGCNSRTRARLGCSRSWRMPTVWFPSEALRISTAHSRPSWQMSSLSLKPPLAALASLAASVLVFVSFQFLLMCFLFGIILELKFMDIEKKYLNFNCRKQKRASFASHDHRPRFFFKSLHLPLPFSFGYFCLMVFLFAALTYWSSVFIKNEELQHLRNSLPDHVVVQRIEERLSALGNCIACNDHVALTHTDLDRVFFPTLSEVCFLVILCLVFTFLCKKEKKKKKRKEAEFFCEFKATPTFLES